MALVICNRVECEHNQGYACNKERIVIHRDGDCLSRSLIIKKHSGNEFVDDYDFKRGMR